VTSLAPPHQRRHNHDLGALGKLQQAVLNLLDRLLSNLAPATITMRVPQARHQQSQIVVDLRDSRHGTPPPHLTGALVDTNRGLQPLDQIHVRPLHLIQKLPRVNRQAFDILPLSFGIQRVERQRTLARAARPRNHHELIARNLQIQILQVVDTSPADAQMLSQLGRGFRDHGRCEAHRCSAQDHE